MRQLYILWRVVIGIKAALLRDSVETSEAAERNARQLIALRKPEKQANVKAKAEYERLDACQGEIMSRMGRFSGHTCNIMMVCGSKCCKNSTGCLPAER